MTSEVVQFRIDKDILDELRKDRINPNEFGREAFQAQLRWRENEERLKRLFRTKIRLEKAAVDLIRDERDRR
jgi:hypothetical protein